MSLQAKILYDYEIQEVERNGGMMIIPLIGYLFDRNPDTDPSVLLYTAQEHVRAFGTNSEYPKELIFPPGYVDEPEVEEIIPVAVQPKVVIEKSEPALVQPSRRTLTSKAKPSKSNKNEVNIRNLFDDIDALNL